MIECSQCGQIVERLTAERICESCEQDEIEIQDAQAEDRRDREAGELEW